jgi:hypothetical protein
MSVLHACSPPCLWLGHPLLEPVWLELVIDYDRWSAHKLFPHRCEAGTWAHARLACIYNWSCSNHWHQPISHSVVDGIFLVNKSCEIRKKDHACELEVCTVHGVLPSSSNVTLLVTCSLNINPENIVRMNLRCKFVIGSERPEIPFGSRT